MYRKAVFIFLLLVFAAAILAALTLLPEEPSVSQATLTPEDWSYLPVVNFARAVTIPDSAKTEEGRAVDAFFAEVLRQYPEASFEISTLSQLPEGVQFYITYAYLDGETYVVSQTDLCNSDCTNWLLFVEVPEEILDSLKQPVPPDPEGWEYKPTFTVGSYVPTPLLAPMLDFEGEIVWESVAPHRMQSLAFRNQYLSPSEVAELKRSVNCLVSPQNLSYREVVGAWPVSDDVISWLTDNYAQPWLTAGVDTCVEQP